MSDDNERPKVTAYLVADDSRQRFRNWGLSGPEWTDDRELALHFARKVDAERFSENDEDAWAIVPLISGGSSV